MTVVLRHGDCVEVMGAMGENAVDAIVTDPPYDLTDMGRRFQGTGGTLKPNGKPRSESRNGGFMGKQWDGTGVAFRPETWAAALRVLKPGGFLLSMGGTRTYHRMVCAIEDAGFVVKDTIAWVHAQGFPKHKWALKPATELIVVAYKPFRGSAEANVAAWGVGGLRIDECRIGGKWTTWRRKDGSINLSAGFADEYVGGTERPTDVRNPEHPAGRWPANLILSHAEGCERVGIKRVKGSNIPGTGTNGGTKPGSVYSGGWGDDVPFHHGDADGLELVESWVCVEGCPVAELDRQSGERPSGGGDKHGRKSSMFSTSTDWERFKGTSVGGDTGGASRFFFVAKASRGERDAGLEGMPERSCGVMQDDSYRWEYDGHGNKIALDTRRRNDHPTVKPIALMRHLVRLVAPPGGLVLDPFAGSGSTGCACVLEGLSFVGIDTDAHYLDIAERRIAYWTPKQQRLAWEVPAWAPWSRSAPPSTPPTSPASRTRRRRG